jgi:hypothetical protein
MKMIATLIAALVIAGLVATVPLANAIYASDAYDSGYGYGCYDSDFRYPADRYINQPGKSPSYHTEAFLIGYLNGFSVCNNKGYQSTASFPELEEGQRWGTCEDKGGDIGLVCDIIEENKK